MLDFLFNFWWITFHFTAIFDLFSSFNFGEFLMNFWFDLSVHLNDFFLPIYGQFLVNHSSIFDGLLVNFRWILINFFVNFWWIFDTFLVWFSGSFDKFFTKFWSIFFSELSVNFISTFQLVDDILVNFWIVFRRIWNKFLE